MFTLRFPLHRHAALKPVFTQLSLAERVFIKEGMLVLQLSEEEFFELKLSLSGIHTGPIGGWKMNPDKDRPTTKAPDGLDFS
ncbi:hypothetical protein [Noviherbaspirillum saxi]|uniref:Uncharacterized protein n=1 Tax=Noviherbaspirillum saxi TaxID=2320863 RepID=A0A3A3FJU9_9BURK|nr:hypothetical protein [Noviherbaspirillum saxi]RJF92668.1 hypothetical protein D3871_29240 [Noviherbaspirillum saxi]